ncbi:MAG: alpha-L-fucosidase [Phycisphaerales bacterium]|nr:alpha-L-fucosidase [Phycisphaerales bacterium]
MPSRDGAARLSSLGASVAPPWTIAAERRPAMPQPTDPHAQPGVTPEPSPRVRAFERMAFGMFVHWGLYSQWGKGEWVKHFDHIPTDEYMQRMKTFTAADFSGRALARLARRAGMRYITLTSRHHDGFSLYDTRGLSPYDVTHTPAGRDLIADFTEGCRAEGIVPMLYCTTLDWTDPRFESDWDGYQQSLRDSIEILCTHYGPIGGFWFDGNWSRPDADWQEDALYAIIRRRQPEAMIINNTGVGKEGVLGHPEIDSTTFERGRPQPIDRTGWPKYVAGEMCHTFNHHWGIAHRDFNSLSPAHVIEELCRCRRAGANLLMNIGPTATGKVPDYEAAALARVGDWIEQIGTQAIYDGRAVAFGADGEDFGLLRETPAGEPEMLLYLFGLTATADTRAHGTDCRGPGARAFRGVPTDLARATWVETGSPARIARQGESCVLHAEAHPYGLNTVVRVARLTT